MSRLLSSDTISLLSIGLPVLVVARRGLSSSVSSAIEFLFLNLTCFVVENVLSHTYVLYMFPNVEGIVSGKSFSLRNLSLLTNFHKLTTVPLTPLVLHMFIKRCYASSVQNIYSFAGWAINDSGHFEQAAFNG